MSKVYYSSTYKTLYDIFINIVPKPLFPLTNYSFNDFFNKATPSQSIVEYLHKYNIYRILKIFIQINAKLRYVSSGSTGHFFKGVIIKDDTKPLNDKDNVVCYFALKLTPYLKNKKYHSIKEVSRPENTELNMLKSLAYFVISGQTRHLLLPVQSFYCPIHEFVRIMEADRVIDKKQRYKKFIADYRGDKYEDVVSVMITELATDGDLLNYIRVHNKAITEQHWKIIFFQLLSTLATIQQQFPAFRHNDLKANNILLQRVEKLSRFSYVINGKTYIIPKYEFAIKIWDFDFACIPGYVDNIKVKEEWATKVNITTRQNRYYDIHFFFATLLSFFPQIMSEEYSGKETIEFINDVLPMKYRINKKNKLVNQKGRLLVDDEYITPLQLIEKHKYFNDFRVSH